MSFDVHVCISVGCEPEVEWLVTGTDVFGLTPPLKRDCVPVCVIHPAVCGSMGGALYLHQLMIL